MTRIKEVNKMEMCEYQMLDRLKTLIYMRSYFQEQNIVDMDEIADIDSEIASLKEALDK